MCDSFPDGLVCLVGQETNGRLNTANVVIGELTGEMAKIESLARAENVTVCSFCFTRCGQVGFRIV